MGARVNYIFDDGTDALVALYSHWGADSIDYDLQEAFRHAEVRRGDHSYWTRMVISYLIQGQVMDETGFGIYAIKRGENLALWGEPAVTIDCATAQHDYVGYDSDEEDED